MPWWGLGPQECGRSASLALKRPIPTIVTKQFSSDWSSNRICGRMYFSFCCSRTSKSQKKDLMYTSAQIIKVDEHTNIGIWFCLCGFNFAIFERFLQRMSIIWARQRYPLLAHEQSMLVFVLILRHFHMFIMYCLWKKHCGHWKTQTCKSTNQSKLIVMDVFFRHLIKVVFQSRAHSSWNDCI